MKTTVYHTPKLVTLLIIVLLASGNNVYSLSDVGYNKQFSFQGSTENSLEEIEQSTKITVQKEKEVTIEMRDGKVFLNESVQVLLADIEASKGIVHLI